MKVTQIITTTKEIDLDIIKVTLLSKEEYIQALKYIPCAYGICWLRSPSHNRYVACVESEYTDLHLYAVSRELCIQPTLIVNNTNLSLGDKFEFAGHRWTVALNNILLCDDIVGRCAFRKDKEAEDANDYEKSDVKKWLEEWWKIEKWRRN